MSFRSGIWLRVLVTVQVPWLPISPGGRSAEDGYLIEGGDHYQLAEYL